MRFEDVLRQLDPLPEVLPEGPPSLMPLLHDADGPRPVPGPDVPGASGTLTTLPATPCSAAMPVPG